MEQNNNVKPKKKWYFRWYMIVLYVWISLSIFGMIILSSGGGSVMNKNYVIEITGTNGVAFQGSIMEVEYGSATSKSVDGTIPKTYTTEGIMSSLAIQKMTDSGTLTVTVKDDNGKVLKTQSTSSPYGMVTIAN